MVTKELAKREEETRELVKAEAKVPIRLTEVGIETIQHNMMMAEKLVMTVLERDVDYGRLPSTPQDGLWDPGASKIINAWNSYPDYTVLHHVEEDGLISYTILSHIISRESHEVVGSGIGACSTRETKYKYRWVPDPVNYGYTPEQIKALKTKTKRTREGEIIDYRIENPEYGELVNTVAKMSAKRADVDAAQSLPGVASALRKLFQGGRKQPDFTAFWGQVHAMGLKDSDVHEMLDVASMKDWIAQGKTLNQAIATLAAKLTERAQRAAKVASEQPAEATAESEDTGAAAPAGPKPEEPEELFPEEQAGTTAEAPKPEQAPKPKRDPESIKTINELLKACNADYGMQPKEVYAELNVKAASEIKELPSECFRRIQAARI